MKLIYRKLKGYSFATIAVFKHPVLVLKRVDFRQHYFSMQDGVLTIEVGYAWDGSSIPLKKLLRVLSLGLYNADKYCQKASLVHDVFCQAMREGLLSKIHKAYIDGLYRDMCIAGGMSLKQASRRYKALRKFGDSGIQKRKNPRGKIVVVK